METIISSVISGEAYWLIDVLSTKLLTMTMSQIDIIWSEATRKKSREILDYLNALINQYETEHSSGSGIAIGQMTFVELLMSSTNRILRDTATKALVTMGVRYPREMFESFKNLERINDWSVVDRLMASLCGVVLQIDENELIKEIAQYLEKSYLNQIKTTHLLILDYIDTILNFAAYRCGYARYNKWRSKLKLPTWPEDKGCKAKITNGKAMWGYGPVHDDFADYIIKPISKRESWNKNQKTPTLEKCLAMIIWRIKKLGYSESLFGKIDKAIVKGSDYGRFHNTASIERYGKKYSWIAFFELLGQFILDGLYESDYGQLLRTSRVDIDPTFPRLPYKKQLINDCFLPDFKENLQDWIRKDTGNYLNKIYLFNLANDGHEWVLLYGSINQESSNDAQIRIVVDTLLVDKKFEDRLIDYLENQWFMNEVPSYSYLFSGEASWSNNILNEETTITYGSEEQNIKVVFPYYMFSWESYHSQMNDIGNVPIISKEIFTELGLTFNVKEQSCRTMTGELAVQLIRDEYSKYLYIRKDFLLDYLERHGLSLVWYEYGTRNGGFKLQDDKKLDPPYIDFRSITTMR
jgi:hypothetical protein